MLCSAAVYEKHYRAKVLVSKIQAGLPTDDDVPLEVPKEGYEKVPYYIIFMHRRLI